MYRRKGTATLSSFAVACTSDRCDKCDQITSFKRSTFVEVCTTFSVAGQHPGTLISLLVHRKRSSSESALISEEISSLLCPWYRRPRRFSLCSHSRVLDVVEKRHRNDATRHTIYQTILSRVQDSSVHSRTLSLIHAALNRTAWSAALPRSGPLTACNTPYSPQK